jgi:hypothetical protein
MLVMLLTGEAAHHRHRPATMIEFVPPRSVKPGHTIAVASRADEKLITSGPTSRSKSSYAILISS